MRSIAHPTMLTLYDPAEAFGYKHSYMHTGKQHISGFGLKIPVFVYNYLVFL